MQFLGENSILAFVIEWGGLILLLALVLAPFYIIRRPRFKPTKWRHIIGAYVGSFGLFLLIFWLLGEVDKWIFNNIYGGEWAQESLLDASFKEVLLLMLIWPLSFFYSIKLLFKELHLRHFFLALMLAISLFVVLVKVWFFLIAYGLGQIGSQYF